MQNLFLLIPFGYLVVIALPLAIIDIREHRLPNTLTLSAAVVTMLCLGMHSALSGNWQAFISASIAALLTFLVGWLLAAKAAIGMGDIKLLISLNAFAGYFSPLLPLLGLTIALMAAVILNAFFLLGKKLTMQSSIALGPYLLAGFFIAVTPSAAEFTVAAWS